LTVKLLRGSDISWGIFGLDLNPRNCPSDFRIKYLCRQFLMCSPENNKMKKRENEKDLEFNYSSITMLLLLFNLE